MTEHTIDEQLIDGRAWNVSTEPHTVHLDQGRLRRIHRLFSRAELALEVQRQASAALQEALIEVFEDGGLSITPQDGYSVDWRAGTLTLKPGEGGQ